MGLGIVIVELTSPARGGANDDSCCHGRNTTKLKNPRQATACRGFDGWDIILYVHAEGLEPPDPIKRPDLQSGTLPITLYTCMRAEALLLLSVLTLRNDPRGTSSFLGKFLATATTELSSCAIAFSAAIAELRFLHSIIWFTVFSHRVINGARTRNLPDHNRMLYLLSYEHHGHYSPASSSLSSTRFGLAPITVLMTSPPRNTIRVGTLITLYC